jgi:hypothetical protein
MFKTFLFVGAFLIAILSGSCSKKSHPTTGGTATENNPTTAAAKKTVKPKSTEPIPKVIVVNDSFAHKSVDGRLYYDVEGHRYWRNKKDGKYYLFNKSMYNDDAFKP